MRFRRKATRLSPGDPWLSVPASRRVWLICAWYENNKAHRKDSSAAGFLVPDKGQQSSRTGLNHILFFLNLIIYYNEIIEYMCTGCNYSVTCAIFLTAAADSIYIELSLHSRLNPSLKTPFASIRLLYSSTASRFSSFQFRHFSSRNISVRKQRICKL
jgi:hypothetical protein